MFLKSGRIGDCVRTGIVQNVVVELEVKEIGIGGEDVGGGETSVDAVCERTSELLNVYWRSLRCCASLKLRCE